MVITFYVPFFKAALTNYHRAIHINILYITYIQLQLLQQTKNSNSHSSNKLRLVNTRSNNNNQQHDQRLLFFVFFFREKLKKKNENERIKVRYLEVGKLGGVVNSNESTTN